MVTCVLTTFATACPFFLVVPACQWQSQPQSGKLSCLWGPTEIVPLVELLVAVTGTSRCSVTPSGRTTSLSL
jgi:hypothetical protein